MTSFARIFNPSSENETVAETLLVETLKTAEKMLFRYGLATLIAISLVVWLAVSVSAKLDKVIDSNTDVQQLLKQHMTETAFYSQATCFNVAGDNPIAASRCIMPQPAVTRAGLR